MGVAAPRAPVGGLVPGTLSKVRSRVLVCWSTDISETSFTNNAGTVTVDSEVRVPPTYPLECWNHFARILQDLEYYRSQLPLTTLKAILPSLR